MLYNCGFSETRELYFFTFRFFLSFCDIGFFAINISADIHQTAMILKTSVFLNDKKRRLLKTISLSQLYSCLSQKTSIYQYTDFDTNLLNIRSAKYLDSLRYILFNNNKVTQTSIDNTIILRRLFGCTELYAKLSLDTFRR